MKFSKSQRTKPWNLSLPFLLAYCNMIHTPLMRCPKPQTTLCVLPASNSHLHSKWPNASHMFQTIKNLKLNQLPPSPFPTYFTHPSWLVKHKPHHSKTAWAKIPFSHFTIPCSFSFLKFKCVLSSILMWLVLETLLQPDWIKKHDLKSWKSSSLHFLFFTSIVKFEFCLFDLNLVLSMLILSKEHHVIKNLGGLEL